MSSKRTCHNAALTKSPINEHIIVEISWNSGETNFDLQKAVEEIGKTAFCVEFPCNNFHQQLTWIT